MYELVMEEITTHHGSRPFPSGGLSMDGPPTTLGDTGIDKVAFAQANITRDNTKFVNGTVVGERDVFQLKPIEEGAGKPPPPILVLHGHYDGCIGDLLSYDAFTLGAPYSVRGYNMGELGACRNILELAAELRVPVRNTHVYVFTEHENDLGSSKDVKGNPTKFFRSSRQGLRMVLVSSSGR